MSRPSSEAAVVPAIEKDARWAGWMYLLMAVPAPFGLIYVPMKLVARGDAARTAANILEHETLFLAGIVALLASAVIFLMLGVALWHLLVAVDARLARLMVLFISVSVALEFAGEVVNLAALTLFRGPDFLKVFDKPQLDALGMLFIGMHQHSLIVNQLFWGLWLLPLGALVMRSGFLPRILGILLIPNGVAYVVASMTALFWPTHYNTVFLLLTPALLAEFCIMLWLLIKGAKRQSPALAG